MRFFDVFMLALGLMSVLTIIFVTVCRLKPEALEHEIVNSIYNFMIGNDVYETE